MLLLLIALSSSLVGSLVRSSAAFNFIIGVLYKRAREDTKFLRGDGS